MGAFYDVDYYEARVDERWSQFYYLFLKNNEKNKMYDNCFIKNQQYGTKALLCKLDGRCGEFQRSWSKASVLMAR